MNGSCHHINSVFSKMTRSTDHHYHQVETFLMNPTFTSKGGFKIVINGVAIYKVANVDINIETN